MKDKTIKQRLREVRAVNIERCKELREKENKTPLEYEEYHLLKHKYERGK